VSEQALLDGLHAAQRELARITVAAGAAGAPPHVLELLIARQDRLDVQIQMIVLADLQAASARVGPACSDIDAATKRLAKLSSTTEDITTAIEIATKVVDVVGGLL
jgi:hypothetical protein